MKISSNRKEERVAVKRGKSNRRFRRLRRRCAPGNASQEEENAEGDKLGNENRSNATTDACQRKKLRKHSSERVRNATGQPTNQQPTIAKQHGATRQQHGRYTE